MYGIREIFLSSTIHDLETYRRDVKRNLDLVDAKPRIYLSEDWTNLFGDTLAEIRRRLDNSDAYYGIFGRWYGSIPPGAAVSITEQEFEWALAKWGERTMPPIVIFMPARSSIAFAELDRVATELLAGLAEGDCDIHRQRLAAFHRRVESPADRWRPVTYFTDKSNLVAHCIVAFNRLNDAVGRAAAGEQPSLARRVPTSAELGRLGREPHFAAIGRSVASARRRPELAAVGLLIGDTVDAGIGRFLDALSVERRTLKTRPLKGHPPFDRFDGGQLLDWLGDGVDCRDRPATAGAVALAIHRRLADGPVAVIAEQIDRFDGGAAGFDNTVWRPLVAALETERRREPPAHQLVFVASDRRLDREAAAVLTGRATGDAFHLVPALEEIDEEALENWLAELEVPADNARWNGIIARALTGNDGARNGTPALVHNRLLEEILWPDGDAS